MPMDATSIGIVVGLGAAASYWAGRAIRQRAFEPDFTLLVAFLGGFSLPGGVELIDAGLTGNVRALPASWREYVAFAGVVVIGLGARFVIQSLQNAWTKPTKAAAPRSD